MTQECCTLIEVKTICLITAGDDAMNRGGLIDLYVLCEDSIVSIPSYNFSFDQYSKAELDGLMLVKSDAIVYHFQFTRHTGGFTETMQETDDGIYYDQLLQVMFPKDRAEMAWLKHQMRQKRYAFLYQDQNGLIKILRNQRVKFDLDTKTKPDEYNGHTMYVRRSSATPALFWKLPAGSDIIDTFVPTEITFAQLRITYPGGFLSGEVVTLDALPLNAEAMVVMLNNAVRLRLGTDYTVTENKIRLNFADVSTEGDSTLLQIFYATEDQATAIGAFVKDTHTRTASYSSGATFTLSDTPISDSALLIYYNQTLLLRSGIDYSRSGTTVTLLFDGTPTALDTDTFDAYYTTEAGSDSVTGFKTFQHKTKIAIATGDRITLPHSPIANSLIVHYDKGIALREGTDYSLFGSNKLQIDFDIPETGPGIETEINVFYAY